MAAPVVARKKWTPKVAGTSREPIVRTPQIAETAAVEAVPEGSGERRVGPDREPWPHPRRCGRSGSRRRASSLPIRASRI